MRIQKGPSQPKIWTKSQARYDTIETQSALDKIQARTKENQSLNDKIGNIKPIFNPLINPKWQNR